MVNINIYIFEVTDKTEKLYEETIILFAPGDGCRR